MITPTKHCANVKMEGGDILRFKTDTDLRGPQGPEQSYTVTSLPYNYYLKNPRTKYFRQLKITASLDASCWTDIHQIKQTLHILHQHHHFQTKHTKTNNTQIMQKVDQPDQKWSLGRTCCGPNSGLLSLAHFKVRISGAPTSAAGTTTRHYRPPHWHSQSTK